MPNIQAYKVTLKLMIQLLIISISRILCFFFAGEMNVTYLFTRYRFNWDEVDFSMFSTYSMITNLIGTVPLLQCQHDHQFDDLSGTSISVGVFSHVLKIDDAIVGIYSSMSKILSSFVYGFAKTSLVFYLGDLPSSNPVTVIVRDQHPCKTRLVSIMTKTFKRQLHWDDWNDWWNE
jgi:hypothetical protein